MKKLQTLMLVVCIMFMCASCSLVNENNDIEIINPEVQKGTSGDPTDPNPPQDDE